jgi:magnesium-transporting ATPase (P-type)
MNTPFWHTLPTTEISKILRTSEKHGLRSDNAEQRLKEYGRNMLTEDAPPAPLLEISHRTGRFGVESYTDVMELEWLAAWT